MRKEFLNPQIQSLQAIIRDLIPCFIYFLVLKSGKLFLFCHRMRNACIKKRIYTHTHTHTPIESLPSSCLQLKQWFWHRKGTWYAKSRYLTLNKLCIYYGQVEQGKEEWGLLLEKEVVPASENNFLGRPMKMAGIVFKKQIIRTS